MITMNAPVTACDLVFGAAGNAAEGLAGAVAARLDGVAALRGLPPATRDAAVRGVSGLGGELLALDLGGLIVTGWCKYAAIVRAARETAAAPGAERIVDVLTHQVGAEAHPSVELLVDDVAVATVTFDLTAGFEIAALSAVIRGGRLVALASGRCRATAGIGVEGVPVATSTAEYDLRLLIRLGDGVPLLDERHTATRPRP